MKNKIILITLSQILIICSASAQGRNGFLSIEPIIGYERVQELIPQPHSKDRLIYGVRASYGPPLLSVEAEVTQGRDSESFPDDGIDISETATNAMLGLRSSIVNGQMIRWYLRAGGHARQVKREVTTAGITEIIEPTINISPYAGTGFTFSFGPMFTLDTGLTVIFSGEPRGSDRDYQTTLGFSIRI
jgi:hypothetical protein